MRVVTILILTATTAHAAVETKSVTYLEGDTELVGYLATNPAIDKPMPGILIVHEWTGLGEHPKNSARRLAELGYVAFALDMYGGGKVVDRAQAAELSGKFKKDVGSPGTELEFAL